MIQIYLNGQKIETQTSNLKAFLEEQHIEIGCVATAIDGTFVPRMQYEVKELLSGMKVEVVSPMQGG